MPKVDNRLLKKLRQDKLLSRRQLALKTNEITDEGESGIDTSTYCRIEKGETKNPSYRVVKLISKILDVENYHDLLLAESEDDKSPIEELQQDEFEQLHEFDLTESLSPLPIKFIEDIPATIRIKIFDDLSKIEYYFNSNKLEINSPKLLLETLVGSDELRLPEDGWIKPTKNIFDDLERSYFIREYFGKNTIIEFDNISINWISLKSPWPPSIDALFLASKLKQLLAKEDSLFTFPINQIADIGCGTGFLGIYFSKLISSIKNVFYSDTHPEATQLALANHTNNYLESKCMGLSGFGLQPFYKTKRSKIDVVVCDPPSIPTFTNNLPTSHSVIATGLVYEIITNFNSISKSLLCCLSIIGKKEIERAIKNSIQKYGTSFKCDIIDSLWVPFRIMSIKEVNLRMLVELGLILDLYEGPNENTVGENIIKENFKDNRSFRYWHQVNIYRFLID